MSEKTTGELTGILKQAHLEDIPAFIDENTSEKLNFPAYMDAIIERTGRKRQDIFRAADIDPKYGYKLLTGEAHTADRDKLLRIFTALEMSLREVQRALEIYGAAPLYPRLRRDAVIMIAFNRGISDVDALDELLKTHGEAPLSR